MDLGPLPCETEFRLAEKPFKRDLVASRARLLADDGEYELTSGGRFDSRPDWFRLDTTHLSPEDAAEQIVARFDLPRASTVRPAG